MLSKLIRHVQRTVQFIYTTTKYSFTARVNLYKAVVRNDISVLRFLPSPSNGLEQICLGDLLAARKVPSRNLGVDLDPRVGWNEVLCNKK